MIVVAVIGLAYGCYTYSEYKSATSTSSPKTRLSLDLVKRYAKDKKTADVVVGEYTDTSAIFMSMSLSMSMSMLGCVHRQLDSQSYFYRMKEIVK